jgi:hypothetical protein
MANYSLVIDSKFRPFSYNDFLAPVQAATTEHKALETAYGELGAQSAAWEERLQNAPQAKQYYDEFQQTLQDATNDLAENGLTMSSRRKALAAREQYANNIVPLEEAWQRQQADIDRQQKSQDKNNGRNIYNYDARTQSLDYYLDPNAKGFVSANLNDITNTGIAGGKALSERYIKTEEGRRFDNYYYSLVKETGMNPQTAMKVLAEMKDENTGDYKFPEFRKFVQDAKTSFGVDANNNAYGYSDLDLSRAEAALFEGINLGITYKENENLYQNPEALAALKARYTKTKEEEDPDIPQNNSIPTDKTETDVDTSYADGLSYGNAGGRETYSNAKIDNARKEAYNKFSKIYDGFNLEGRDPQVDYDRVMSNPKVKQSLKELEELSKGGSQTMTEAHARGEEIAKKRKELGKEILSILGHTNASDKESLAAFMIFDGTKIERKKINEAKQELDKKINDYRRYGNNIQNIIHIASTLEKNQSVKQNSFIGYTKDPSVISDVKAGIMNLNTKSSTQGAYKIDAKGNRGEAVDTDDLKDMLSSDEWSPGVIYRNGVMFLGLANNDNEVVELGDDYASEANKTLRYISKHLGDFDPLHNNLIGSTSNTIDVRKSTPEQLINFINDVSENKKDVWRKEEGFWSCIVTNKDKNEAVKIIVPMGKEAVPYIQYLSDEVNNQGRRREATLNQLANGYMFNYKKSFASDLTKPEKQ